MAVEGIDRADLLDLAADNRAIESIPSRLEVELGRAIPARPQRQRDPLILIAALLVMVCVLLAVIALVIAL